MGQPGPVLEAYAVRDRSETIFNLYGAFRNAKVPIIGISGHTGIGEEEAATTAGMNAFLAKPVSPAALAQVVAKFAG